MKFVFSLIFAICLVSASATLSFAGEDTAEFLTPQIETEEAIAPEVAQFNVTVQDQNPALAAKIMSKIKNRGTWAFKFVLVKPGGQAEVLSHYRENSLMKPASTLKLFTGWMAYQKQVETPWFINQMLKWSINDYANKALHEVDALNFTTDGDTAPLTEAQLLALHTRSFSSFYSDKLILNASNFRPVDGSGLSYSNKLTAQAEIDLLALIFSSPQYDDFKKMLVTPSTGTLLEEHRFTQFAYPLYAKTGTLADTAALTGFVELPEGTLAFTLISNQLQVSLPVARKIIDSVVVDHVAFLKARSAAEGRSH